MNSTVRPGPIQGLPMIGIDVTDMDRAVDFYRDVLGLPVASDFHMDQLDGRLVILTVPGSDAVLALFPANGQEPTASDTGIRLKVDDAHAWYEYLRDGRARVHEMLEWPGVPPMFIFEDPDQNRLVVVS